MDDKETDAILRLLTIVECKLQKALYKKEQTECESECSKEQLETINRKLNLLLLCLHR